MVTTRSIPLARPFLDAREEELVLDVLRSGTLALGPMLGRFEEAFARFTGRRHQKSDDPESSPDPGRDERAMGRARRLRQPFAAQ